MNTLLKTRPTTNKKTPQSIAKQPQATKKEIKNAGLKCIDKAPSNVIQQLNNHFVSTYGGRPIFGKAPNPYKVDNHAGDRMKATKRDISCFHALLSVFGSDGEFTQQAIGLDAGNTARLIGQGGIVVVQSHTNTLQSILRIDPTIAGHYPL
jgi:hypothetical protein